MAELAELYSEMSALTAPFCADKCPNKFKCCERIHCENAAKFAKDHYGIDLVRGEHPELPFMGPEGCTVAPHLRPTCTLHTCFISKFGLHPYDSAFTDQYFKIRFQIETLEKQSCPAS